MHYTVSSAPGSQGPSLAMIIFNLANDFESPTEISVNNPPYILDSGVNTYNSDVFSHLSFPENLSGVFSTRTLVNLEEVANNANLANTKFVIVKPSAENYAEITKNTYCKVIEPLSKQYFTLTQEEKDLFDPEAIEKIEYAFNSVKEKFNVTVTAENINYTDVQQKLYSVTNNKNNELLLVRYSKDVVIPAGMEDRVCVINYDDIFTPSTNGSYVALDQLVALTGKQPNSGIMQLYTDMVDEHEALRSTVYQTL